MQPTPSMTLEAIQHRLSQVLYGCLEDMGYTKAALYLRAAPSSEFTLASHYGWPRTQPLPPSLGPQTPFLLLMQRERRGLLTGDLAAYPELDLFRFSAERPRFYIKPIYDHGEWVGMLILRDPPRGGSFSMESHEAPTQLICQAILTILSECAPGTPPRGPAADPEAPMGMPVLRVAAPPTRAMVQPEERPMQTAQGPSPTEDSPGEYPSPFFFWELADLLCRMVQVSAVCLFSGHALEPGPVHSYSLAPLSLELQRSVLNHFTDQLPNRPKDQLRLSAHSKHPDWEPQGGPFLVALPILLQEQLGTEDLLFLFRRENKPFTSLEENFIRKISRMLGFYLQEVHLHERYHESFLSVSHRILASAEGRLPSLRTQSVNTAKRCSDLAQHLKLPAPDVEAVRISAILHDVGTLLLDRSILEKPALSIQDREQIQTHPILASTFLKDFKFPFDILHIIRHHHERWDGQGYPDGIKGEAIPMGSRIIHLVESFEVMTSGTPYRAPKPEAAALRELEELAGIHFDPRLVKAFVQMIRARHP